MRDLALDLGNRLNEVMQVINEIHAYNPDNESMSKLIRELRSKSSAKYVRGSMNVTVKDGNMEVVYVLSASGYRDAINDVINYFTNILMAIRQVIELTEKLGINDEYVTIIDDSSIDVIIGYPLPDITNTSLLQLPSIEESVEVPSVLSGITGLTADELAKVMIMIDNALSAVGKSSRSFETVVRLDDINYPEPFKKVEELIGGAS